MGKSPALLSLICFFLLGSSLGQSSSGQGKGEGKGKCTGWETKLAGMLTAPIDFPQFLKDNAQNLPKLSSSCVTSFNASANLTAVTELMKVLNVLYDQLNEGTRKAVYMWVETVFMSYQAKKLVKPEATVNPNQLKPGVTAKPDNSNNPSKANEKDQQSSASGQGPRLTWYRNQSRARNGVYQKLLKSVDAKNISADDLKKLGPAAAGLGVSQLGMMSKEKVKESLSVLRDIKDWSSSQKNAILDKLGEVTGSNLTDLGYLASALKTTTIKKMNGKDLLEAFNKSMEVSDSTNAMKPVQKKAIIQEVLKEKLISEVLKNIPPGLLSAISATTLKNASDTSLSLDFLNKSLPWNKGQALVIIKKIIKSLKNKEDLSMLTTAVTGLTCGDIRNMSLDSLRTLAGNENLTRDQVNCGSKVYFQTLMKAQNFSTLNNTDISQIPPSFLLYSPNFTDLMKWNGSFSCSSVVAVLVKANPQLLPMSSGRRSEALKYIKTCWGISDTRTLTSDQVANLGLAVCFFNAEDIQNLNDTVFVMAVKALEKCGKFKREVKDSLAAKITTVYGDASNWTSDNITELRSLLSVLDRRQMKMIKTSSEMVDILKGILSSVTKPVDFVPPDLDFTPDMSGVTEAFTNMVLNPSNQTSARRRRREACTTVPTEDQIRKLGEGSVVFSASDLKCMTTDTFKNTLDILGSLKALSKEQLDALKAKAIEAFGNETVKYIPSLKRIVLAFSLEDVGKYFVSPNIDMLAAVGEYRDWLNGTLLLQAQAIVTNFLKNSSAGSLDSSSLVGLGYFLCVFPPEQVKMLNASEFRNAARSIGKLGCSSSSLAALKEKAKEAFGPVSSWSEELLQELGTILAGLNTSEISTLPESVMSYLTPQAVSLLSKNVFSGLTVGQLRSLGTENYAAVSLEQRQGLSLEQLRALDENSGTRDSSSSAAGATARNIPMFAAILLSLVALSVLH
nr:PREDICTED: otoancorin-like [Lepisosteus oculatus]